MIFVIHTEIPCIISQADFDIDSFSKVYHAAHEAETTEEVDEVIDAIPTVSLSSYCDGVGSTMPRNRQVSRVERRRKPKMTIGRASTSELRCLFGGAEFVVEVLFVS